MSHDFKESAKNTVHLPEDKPHIFGKVCEWFYTGKIAELYAEDLVKVYTFADIRGIRKLRNYLIDRYLESCCKQGGTTAGSFMRYVDENTANSKLKDAMAAAMARVYDDTKELEMLSAEERHKYFTVDMLTRVVIELRKTNGNTGESLKHDLWMKRCHFHEHEAGEPRCDDDHEEVRGKCIRYEDSGTEISDAETMDEEEAKQWQQEFDRLKEERQQDRDREREEHDRFIQDLKQRRQDLDRDLEQQQEEIDRLRTLVEQQDAINAGASTSQD